MTGYMMSVVVIGAGQAGQKQYEPAKAAIGRYYIGR